MSYKILLGPSSFGETDKAPFFKLQEAGYEVVDNPFKRKLTKQELFDLLTPDVIGIIAGLEPLDREVLSRSKLKVVSRVGSGISNVDLEAAEELGIIVRSTPYGPTEAAAELTLGALLSLLRKIPRMDQALHAGRWEKRIGTQLEGKTVAIIGYGRIGKRVAELLAPFHVRLLVVDPNLEQSAVGAAELMSLDEALPWADIITLHSSGEACLLGEQEFRRMKQGAFLLNVARGGLVAEEALVEALDDGKVAGAWIDTFGMEPYKGPLCGRENVVLTPHVGSYTLECRQGMENEAVENLLAVTGKCC
ncbi:MAG: hydroxyacid dehydrogenase [Deltaproteobacteria bacterium]|uniref:NAD(P)-dependent oxidoreductase n=1 Tax=Hydrosulfovibrio ferrireducens TaxID=2934181 RepID=UPI00120543E5|nr:MAG: hydroxyacid dehydrogenase [Deltaproteobacteria bacterium]